MKNLAVVLVIITLTLTLAGCNTENKNYSNTTESIMPDTPSNDYIVSPPGTPSPIVSGSSGGSNGSSAYDEVIFQESHYVPASMYRINEDLTLRNLIGEQLEGAPAGMCNVIGYSELFRLCTVNNFTFSDGKNYELLRFYEAYNAAEMVYGSDLFGECLHLAENWEQVRYISHNQWDSTHPQEYVYQDLQGVSEENVISFITELYSGIFEDISKSSERDGFFSNNEQAHLYFFLHDNTRIDLRLVKGGYVGYEHYIWQYIKIPGETFDLIFSACQ